MLSQAVYCWPPEIGTGEASGSNCAVKFNLVSSNMPAVLKAGPLIHVLLETLQRIRCQTFGRTRLSKRHLSNHEPSLLSTFTRRASPCLLPKAWWPTHDGKSGIDLIQESVPNAACRFEETKCHFNAQLASVASSVAGTGITVTVIGTTIQPHPFQRNRDMHRVALEKSSSQNP